MSVRNRLRTSVRSLLRPVWLMVWYRIEMRIKAMDAANHRFDDAWQQHIPAFLNAVSTVGAFGHELLRYRKETLANTEVIGHQLATLSAQLKALAALQEKTDDMSREQRSMEARIAELDARIEFVRRELLFETEHAGVSKVPRPTTLPSLKPCVLSPEKLAAAQHSILRLNLGCGRVPLDGYVNVDTHALPGVDIIAEAGHLPLEPGTVQEIRSVHLLGHFSRRDLRERLLPYWLSLLVPRGTFRAIVSDGEAILARCATENSLFEEFHEVLSGVTDRDADLHCNMFLPQSLCALLEETGFVDTRVPVRDGRNGLRYEFEINARRP
jgi:hypothetical protein